MSVIVIVILKLGGKLYSQSILNEALVSGLFKCYNKSLFYSTSTDT